MDSEVLADSGRGIGGLLYPAHFWAFLGIKEYEN